MKKTIFSFVLPFVLMAVVTIFAYNMDTILYTDSNPRTVYADSGDNPPENVATDVSGMFNERGYYKANSLSFDESEIINNFNGDLSYTFPMYNMKGPGDMYIDFSLNYNGAINYQLIAGTLTQASLSPNLPRYNFNAPGWILSLNGMAVQMFNFETNFFSHPNSLSGTQLGSDDANLLATGYHITDGLKTSSGTDADVISIMRGDGSVITLKKVGYGTCSDDSCYIGEYESESKGDYTRAVVKYIEGGPLPSFRNRQMSLMRGDGLTFIYEENKVRYDDFPFINNASQNFKPQSFLLKRIVDRYGHEVELSYTYQVNLGFQGIYPVYGRPLLTSISGQWLGSAINFNYTQAQSNGAVVINNYRGRYKIYCDEISMEDNGEHRSSVTKIVNSVEDEVNIGYIEAGNTGYTRVAERMNNPYTSNWMTATLDLKRINKVTNYNGGIREYFYKGGNSTALHIDMSPPTGQKIQSNVDSNYLGQGRDVFYNNMITKKVSILEGDTLSIEKFLYNYYDADNNRETDPVDPDDNFFATKITKAPSSGENLNGTPEVFKATRLFKNYLLEPGYILNPDNPDWPGHNKMVQETYYLTDTSNFYKKVNYEFIGGLTGSYLDTAVTENIEGITSKVRIQYQHEGGDQDKPLVKRTEIDPLGMKTETTYKIFYQDSPHYRYAKYLTDSQNQDWDTTRFYMINTPEKVESFSPQDNMIHKETTDYLVTNSDTGYMGQPVSSKVYNNTNYNDFKEITYSYFVNDTLGESLYTVDNTKPSTEGNLKAVTDAKGNTTKFYYHPVKSYSTSGGDQPPLPPVPYIFTYDDGTVDTMTSAWEDKRFATITEVFPSSNYSFETFRKYDPTGNTVLDLSPYMYATEFTYDRMERVQTATLPFDFNNDTNFNYNDTIIDTSYIPFETTISSYAWGSVRNQPGYHVSSSGYPTGIDSIFKMDIYKEGGSGGTGASDHEYLPLMAFNDSILTSNSLYSIEYAFLDFYPMDFTHSINGDTTDSVIKFKVQTVKDYHPGQLELGSYAIYTDIPIYRTSNQSCYYIRDHMPEYFTRFDVTELMDSIIVSGEDFEGFQFKVEKNTLAVAPSIDVKMNFGRCIISSGSAGISGQQFKDHYSPRVVLKGVYLDIDTTILPVRTKSTLRHVYDDTLYNRTSVLAKIDNNTNKKTEHYFDGFYRIKQSRLYTGVMSYDSTQIYYNYLDMQAKTVDGRTNETKVGYDKYGNADSIMNADTSYTLTETTFQNGITTRLSTVTERVTKQVFKDEEGNRFIKYSDVVGNLVREEKFLDGSVGESGDIPLYTDYLYDSLYRVIKVKTPEGKEMLYEYDGYNRQRKRTTVDAGVEQYKYDINDNIRFSQNTNQDNDAGDLMTFNGYDGLNRVLYVGEAPLSGGGDAPGGWNTLIPDSSYAIEDFSANPGNFLIINVYDSLSTAYADTFSTKKPSDYYSEPNYTTSKLIATAYRTRNTDNFGYKFYRYDKRGRMIKMWHVMDGLDTKVIDYNYNSLNQVTHLTYQYNVGGEFKKFNYAYDTAARLGDVSVFEPTVANDSTDAIGAYVKFAEYDYDANSLVANRKLNDAGVTTSYTYNKRNWIIGMTGDTKFGYTMTYYKNGNVKTQLSSGSYNDNFPDKDDITMTYGYDWCNRLTSANATSHSGSAHDLTNTYDKDGNLLTMQRYNSGGTLADNFAYAYISGTNKLDRVTGGTAQYTYDYNGNVTKDDNNGLYGMKYDHRNLLLEYKEVEVENGDDWTRYYYDEMGNRVRKITMRTSEKDPIDPNWDAPGDDPYWTVIRDIRYIRGARGNEIALYNGTEIDQWNVWGSGNEGKIDSTDNKFFYMKDHLSSVRAVLDTSNAVVSGNDYDLWGYQLDGRSYILEETDYKFTGKERDKESNYDYFGARYFDSRVGRWGGTEPLLEKYPSWTCYQYGLCNPMKFLDGNGLDVYIQGDNTNEVFSQLESYSDLDMEFDAETGKISTSITNESEIDNESDKLLWQAINSENISVNLTSTGSNNLLMNDVSGESLLFYSGGGYGGNRMINGRRDSRDGEIEALQYINLATLEQLDEAGVSSVGKSIAHEIGEAYISAVKGWSFTESHNHIVNNVLPESTSFQFGTDDGETKKGYTKYYLVVGTGDERKEIPLFSVNSTTGIVEARYDVVDDD